MKARKSVILPVSVKIKLIMLPLMEEERESSDRVRSLRYNRSESAWDVMVLTSKFFNMDILMRNARVIWDTKTRPIQGTALANSWPMR